jgi:hypothetical protein
MPKTSAILSESFDSDQHKKGFKILHQKTVFCRVIAACEMPQNVLDCFMKWSKKKTKRNVGCVEIMNHAFHFIRREKGENMNDNSGEMAED